MFKSAVTVCCFILFVLIPTLSVGQQNIPYFKNLSVEKGLPDYRISNVIQDNQGILWMSSRFGISKYNGRKIISYSFKNNTSIREFLIDKDDKLWVATSEGLFYYHKKKDIFERLVSKNKSFDALLKSSIIALFQSDNGKIWFSTNNGQFASFRSNQAENGKIYKTDASVAGISPFSKITAIVEDHTHNLWVGTDTGKLLCFDPSAGKFIENLIDTSIEVYIRDMAIDSESQLWVATNGSGVYKINLKNGSSTQYVRHANSYGKSVNKNIILSLMIDSDNNVWMGTDGGGLNLYRAQENDFVYFKRRRSMKTSLSDNSILSISQGLHDIIWVGTVHGGVTYFKRNLEIFNIPPEKMFFNNARQGSRILEDSNGDLWITAGRNGLRKYDPVSGEVSIFTADINNSKELSGNIILSLMEDSRGRIWMGTLYEGLNVYDIESKSFLPIASNNLNTVSAIEEHDNGNIWVGSDAGITIYNASLEIVKKINAHSGEGLSNNVVNSIYKDIKGDMWVGTVNGLNVMSKGEGKFKTYFSIKSDSTTLSSNHILSIAEGADLSVWVGTYGFGVNRYSRASGEFERINKKDGLKGTIVRGILLDTLDNIWLSTNLGLSKVGATGIVNYGVKEGVPAFHGGSAEISTDGKIYFAGEEGLSFFWPDKLKIHSTSPRVFFTGLHVLTEEGMKKNVFHDNKDRSYFSLQPDDQFMTVNFGSSNYWNPEENSFSYKLKGLNNQWNNIGQQQSISFSNLSPGDYTLEIKVANKNGEWSPYRASLNFNVLPSFWQKTGVRIFSIFMGVLMIYFFVKWRSNHLKLQQKKLRSLIDLRTEEVKIQKDRVFKKDIEFLTVQNENEKLKQRKLLDELNFKKRELTNNTIRTLHKNNLLTNVKEELVKEMKKNPQITDNIGEIIGQIDDSLAVDKDWKNFYELFDQVHPTFIDDLKSHSTNLSNRDIKLCALIKLNFSSQHIATLFGISLSSVKVARHRLRKKLDIPKEISFKDFLNMKVFNQ